MTTHKPRSTFVEFHVLRSFPPSNLNRDDLGSPKTAIFGGERRLRISSQCLKRTWRTSEEMTGAFAEDQLGVRTSHLPEQVLALVATDLDAGQKEGLLTLLGQIGRKSKKADKGSEVAASESAEAGDASEGESAADAAPIETETAHLLFLSRQEIEVVARFARENAEKLGKVIKPGKKRALNTKALEDLRKAFTAYLAEKTTRNAVDVGLFGRFITSDELDTIDGALHVAHALGTQRVELEYDYFTAVDDLGTSTGAGHLGESEFASSVMYLYACCDLNQLETNLGKRAGNVRTVDGEARQLAAKSLVAILRAMAIATPKGKKTGTAPYAPAEYVEVVVRQGQPLSFANAFLKPAKPSRELDVLETSIQSLVAHREKLERGFELPAKARFVFSLRDVEAATTPSLSDLGAKLAGALADRAAT